jgi:hypothetical protein
MPEEERDERSAAIGARAHPGYVRTPAPASSIGCAETVSMGERSEVSKPIGSPSSEARVVFGEPILP